MKVLSKASVYGLRALIYMAARGEGRAYVSVREMSAALGISAHFLTKICQLLTRQGLLITYRGPHGGVAMKIPPEQLFVIDVVHVLDGRDFFDTCLLGLPGCGDEAPCPVHAFWKEIKDVLKEEFSTLSLAELGAKVNAKRYRLSSPPGTGT